MGPYPRRIASGGRNSWVRIKVTPEAAEPSLPPLAPRGCTLAVMAASMGYMLAAM